MTAPLDVYDIAYLAGGATRTVDTAIVALVLDGRLRVHAPGRLAGVNLSRQHPVEAALFDACPPIGHRSVDTICWRLVDDERLLDIGHRLHKAGLLGRMGAAVSVLHGVHRGLAPTRAGYRVLREVANGPPLGHPEAVRVAMGGREAMTDARLRSDIFELPVSTLGPPGQPRSRDIDDSDPGLTAYLTGGTAASAGVYLETTDGGGL